MNILAVDTAGKTLGVALLQDDRLKYECYLDGGMTQSAVSHQLRILKNNKLVKFRREGKTVFYGLDDDHVRSILKLGMEHLGD